MGALILWIVAYLLIDFTLTAATLAFAPQLFLNSIEKDGEKQFNTVMTLNSMIALLLASLIVA